MALQKSFELAENIGQVIDQKVDDAKRQFEVVNKRKHSIALVTDSIADLANEFMKKSIKFMF